MDELDSICRNCKKEVRYLQNGLCNECINKVSFMDYWQLKTHAHHAEIVGFAFWNQLGDIYRDRRGIDPFELQAYFDVEKELEKK